ncbi:MAG: glycine/sarcosine/betaine reductase component B subunit [Clostridia bacterium]|nr:glycine/sarcosine/betaine reductase component B subunit [Clostridia bacterium]
MNLELRKINIKDIVFDTENKIVDGVLHVNPKDLEELVLEDSKVESVSFDIARPGESTRIVPVKDVIEPRAKLDGEAFPGLYREDMQEAGDGITYCLKNMAITTTGPIVGFQEGVIDMMGPMEDYTIYSHINHLCMIIEKKDFVDQHDHEEVVRLAGIKVAKFVGEIGFDVEEYETETIEWKSIGEKYMEYPDLPKVVYVYNCMAQGLLHDTYFYGRDAKVMVPTMITPGEVMDGALISGNCVSPGSKTTTYMHQNNAVIRELLKVHGKEINFMGIVLNPLMTTLKEKFRDRMLTVREVKMLGADGVVISQEGFGNPTTDLMIVCQELENAGVKVVIITNEDAGVDGMSESLPDSVQEANAIVSTGNSNATVMLPAMEKTIGNLKEVERVCGGNITSIQDDGRLLLEIHGIMGSHNLQGNTKVGCVTL